MNPLYTALAVTVAITLDCCLQLLACHPAASIVLAAFHFFLGGGGDEDAQMIQFEEVGSFERINQSSSDCLHRSNAESILLGLVDHIVGHKRL